MNPALAAMLAKYPRGSVDENVGALREIIQELALLGLWRGKFFEHAAFYGGTALRILYGLDRFSEDMDFSLLEPDHSFTLERYRPYVEEELASWGFEARLETKRKSAKSAVESAFLKADTRQQLLVIEASEEVAGMAPKLSLKIKIEVDTDPPPDFSTEAKFCLQPIPFSVRVYTPPCLFAGKLHALLCRGWKERVKGRDWYDFVWYVGRGTPLDLRHLEARMRQSGHWREENPLTKNALRRLLADRIGTVDLLRAKTDIKRFLSNPSSLELWSREFFLSVAERLTFAEPEND